MSCLNLRLPPAKKAWKSFTLKLQSKLHKLHKSKAIKKPKYQLNTTSSKGVRPSILFKRRDRNRRQLLYSQTFPSKQYSCRFHFQKKSEPVYIDMLFRDAVADQVMESCAPRVKKMELLRHQADTVPAGGAGQCIADDMWESLGFASPQMQGIDERAEQFISSFRADMEIQETMERGL